MAFRIDNSWLRRRSASVSESESVPFAMCIPLAATMGTLAYILMIPRGARRGQARLGQQLIRLDAGAELPRHALSAGVSGWAAADRDTGRATRSAAACAGPAV